MQIKEEFTLITQGNRMIRDYPHTVMSLVDEIALIDHSISNDDITIYNLNGLGSDFQAWEKSLTFEELHDLLIGHEG